MAATTIAAAPARTAVRTLPAIPSFRIFRTLHLWLGLSFGLLLVCQGLSGAALVWRPELDSLLLPGLLRVDAGTAESAPFARLDGEFQAVKQAAPGASVRAVRLPLSGSGSDQWAVQMPSEAIGGGPRWTVYTSPATGQVLGIRGKKKDALQWLIELHHNLLFGPLGRNVQGVLTMATVLLALSGLWLWWPRSLTLSRFRPRATARPLHYAVGFWAMWPLLVIATTAMYFVWRQPIQHLFGVPSGRQGSAEHSGSNGTGHAHGPQSERHAATGEASARVSETGDDAAVSLRSVLTAAQAAAPEARLTMLRLPDGHGPFVVMFEEKAEQYRDAPNSLTLRVAAEGGVQVVHRSLWRDLPAKQRFLEWLPRLHQGEFGGIWIRTLWSITGFAPAVLYISGFLMWRRRITAERRVTLSQ